MTRADVLARYDVDAAGRITTPGMFEHEKLYVPYFWDMYLNGFAEIDYTNSCILCHLNDWDKEQFPELRGRGVISLRRQQWNGAIREV